MSQKERDTYHLYGRTSYPQPLTFVTSVTIPRGEAPQPPEGEAWVELVAIPQSAIIRVIPGPKEKKV